MKSTTKKTTLVTVRIDPVLLAKARAFADAKGMTMKALVALSISKYIQRFAS